MPRSCRRHATLGSQPRNVCMTHTLLAVAAVSALHLPVATLEETSRSFPQDASAPRAIFVVTFGKSASEQARTWSRRLNDMKGELSAEIVQVAVLEDVPRLFRGAVRSGIARSVPPALHARFWIAETGSREWKECAGGESGTEAYVFVLDHRSRIVWRTQGACSEEKIRALLALPPP
jgi:hypothetical protein